MRCEKPDSVRESEAGARTGHGGHGHSAKPRSVCASPGDRRVLALTRAPAPGLCPVPKLDSLCCGPGCLARWSPAPALLPGALPLYTHSPTGIYSPSTLPECVLSGYKEQD